MTTRDIVFAASALVAAASALLAVTTRHVVHAALWLVVSLGTLAGCYLVLGAELVGAGAAAGLRRRGRRAGALRADADPRADRAQRRASHASVPQRRRRRGRSAAGDDRPARRRRCSRRSAARRRRRVRDGRHHGVATALFGTWVWPFELLSLLLLVALVGAFAVSRLCSPRRPVPPCPTPSAGRRGAA